MKKELQVCYINLKKEVEAPIIECAVENNPGLLTFFCDSGAKPNLIKENAINLKFHKVNREEILKLMGINSEPVYTLGTVELKIENAW